MKTTNLCFKYQLVHAALGVKGVWFQFGLVCWAWVLFLSSKSAILILANLIFLNNSKKRHQITGCLMSAPSVRYYEHWSIFCSLEAEMMKWTCFVILETNPAAVGLQSLEHVVWIRSSLKVLTSTKARGDCARDIDFWEAEIISFFDE